MQSHIHMVYACLAVTCLLHFWQNDWDLLHATAVTRVWNGYRIKSQHRKLTLEKKILPPLLWGFRPVTFESWVRHSNHWSILLIWFHCRHQGTSVGGKLPPRISTFFQHHQIRISFYRTGASWGQPCKKRKNLSGRVLDCSYDFPILSCMIKGSPHDDQWLAVWPAVWVVVLLIAFI